jgi:flagellar assembly protein FliH
MPLSSSAADTDDLFAQAAAASTPDAAPAVTRDVKPFVMESLHTAAAMVITPAEPIVSDAALALLSSQRSGSTYARFVPGEEIHAVHPWQFNAVDPRERDRVDLAAAERQRSQLEAELRRDFAQMLEREREAAREQGQAAGVQQAQAAAQASHQQEVAALHAQHRQACTDLLAQFHHHISAHREVQAQAVLQLACDVARQVLRRQLQVDAQSVLPVIHEALAMVDDAGQRVTVYLHPDDVAAAQAAAESSGRLAVITWVPDATMTVGGLRVQHGGATLDASVATRWRRVVASLGVDAPWDRPGDPGDGAAPAGIDHSRT